MKYSFMSFSCPDADFDRMLELAAGYGYEGVEPRVANKHRHGIELEADDAFLEEIRKKGSQGSVRISCLATSCKYSEPEKAGESVALTGKYLELARKIGAPRIRVFGGMLPEGMARGDAIELVVDSLKKVSEHADREGVNVCVETHDDWCDPRHLAEVLEKAGHPRIKANWDIMHPVRRAGVSIEESFKILKGWVDHVHFHDGNTLAGDKLELVPVGQGEIDHRKAVELLRAAGYEGYLSGEWIKWRPAEEHLPGEIQTMRSYEKPA